MRSGSIKRVDLHLHSHFSSDGNMPPGEIIKFAKKNGLDAIAVTDHNNIKGGIETRKISKHLIVLVGSEIKTNKGEIIGLNLKKDVPYGLSPIKTCKLIREQGGFVVIPHPFDKFRNGIGNEMKKIIEYIDAVEIFNARTIVDSFNKQSFEFAKKHRLPFVAGSDSHFKSEIGSVSMLVECKKDKNDILKAIKEGKVKISGKKTGIMPHWKTFVRKIRKGL